jgi:long-chain acyl-CoA synthetase
VTNITIKTLLKLNDIGRLRLVISYDPLDEESKTLLRQRNLQYLDFWDIIKQGSELKDVNDANIKTNINDCYTFSYTSGTTGPPKGAMISHKNILACGAAFARHEELKFNSEDRYLSYLPLPHLMERAVSIAMFYAGAYLVYILHYSGSPAEIH